MLGLFKHKHKWVVRRTIWPFKDGWGTYCPGCETIMDTGLPKEEAEERAKAMNKEAKRGLRLLSPSK